MAHAVKSVNHLAYHPGQRSGVELTLIDLRGYFGLRESTRVLGRWKVVLCRTFLTLCGLT